MMSKTLEIDGDEILDDDKEVPDEEPPKEHDKQYLDRLFEDMSGITSVKDHRTREEGEIAPLDALYPTMQVSSDGEMQQTHHRMTAMHESTNKEDVQNESYQETGSRAKTMMMMALCHPRDRRKPDHKSSRRQGASRRQGEGEDQEDPLHHGGGGGITKCNST
jgi:hypothetical protein